MRDYFKNTRFLLVIFHLLLGFLLLIGVFAKFYALAVIIVGFVTILKNSNAKTNEYDDRIFILWSVFHSIFFLSFICPFNYIIFILLILYYYLSNKNCDEKTLLSSSSHSLGFFGGLLFIYYYYYFLILYFIGRPLGQHPIAG